MKLRNVPILLPTLLAFSLAVAACGTDAADTEASDTDAGISDGADRPAATTTRVEPGRGWLEGEDLDWLSGSSGGDGAAEPADAPAAYESAADVDRASSADSAELSSEISPISPPIVDSPLRAGSIDDEIGRAHV